MLLNKSPKRGSLCFIAKQSFIGWINLFKINENFIYLFTTYVRNALRCNMGIVNYWYCYMGIVSVNLFNMAHGVSSTWLVAHFNMAPTHVNLFNMAFPF